jgi:hypothetical protein
MVLFQIIYFTIIGIAGPLLHGIVGSYVLGTGGLVMIGASRTISGVFGIAAAGKCQGLLLINVTDSICNIGPFASIP